MYNWITQYEYECCENKNAQTNERYDKKKIK